MIIQFVSDTNVSVSKALKCILILLIYYIEIDNLTDDQSPKGKPKQPIVQSLETFNYTLIFTRCLVRIRLRRKAFDHVLANL